MSKHTQTSVKEAEASPEAPGLSPEQDLKQTQLTQLWSQYGILRARRDSIDADLAKILSLISELQKGE